MSDPRYPALTTPPAHSTLTIRRVTATFPAPYAMATTVVVADWEVTQQSIVVPMGLIAPTDGYSDELDMEPMRAYVTDIHNGGFTLEVEAEHGPCVGDYDFAYRVA